MRSTQEHNRRKTKDKEKSQHCNNLVSCYCTLFPVCVLETYSSCHNQYYTAEIDPLMGPGGKWVDRKCVWRGFCLFYPLFDFLFFGGLCVCVKVMPAPVWLWKYQFKHNKDVIVLKSNQIQRVTRITFYEEQWVNPSCTAWWGLEKISLTWRGHQKSSVTN